MYICGHIVGYRHRVGIVDSSTICVGSISNYKIVIGYLYPWGCSVIVYVNKSCLCCFIAIILGCTNDGSISYWKYLTRSYGLAYRMYICGHIVGYLYRGGIVESSTICVGSISNYKTVIGYLYPWGRSVSNYYNK